MHDAGGSGRAVAIKGIDVLVDQKDAAVCPSCPHHQIFNVNHQAEGCDDDRPGYRHHGVNQAVPVRTLCDIGACTAASKQRDDARAIQLVSIRNDDSIHGLGLDKNP